MSTRRKKTSKNKSKLSSEGLAARACLNRMRERIATAWTRIEAGGRGGRLAPGLPEDHELSDIFDSALDTYYVPEALLSSLALRNGEKPGKKPGVVAGLRLLGFEDMCRLALGSGLGGEKLSAEIEAALAMEAKHVKAGKKRAADDRVPHFGPDQSWTFALGAGGHRLVLDISAGADDAPVLEYLASGKIRWCAPGYLDWLEAISGITDGS